MNLLPATRETRQLRHRALLKAIPRHSFVCQIIRYPMTQPDKKQSDLVINLWTLRSNITVLLVWNVALARDQLLLSRMPWIPLRWKHDFRLIRHSSTTLLRSEPQRPAVKLSLASYTDEPAGSWRRPIITSYLFFQVIDLVASSLPRKRFTQTHLWS